MKYSKEYHNTKTREGFIKLVLINYPKLKQSSALRRYYDMKKIFGEQKPLYSEDEKIEPNFLKKLELKEMKKFKQTITREFLRTHGFNNSEINWLIEEGEINV